MGIQISNLGLQHVFCAHCAQHATLKNKVLSLFSIILGEIPALCQAKIV